MLLSCAKDNVADLKKANTPPTPSTVTGTVCDTASISFSAKIVPLMETHCGSKDNSCHTQSAKKGGVYLDSYDGVKDAIGKKLYSSIVWDGNTTRMPFGRSKLDNCTISIVNSWINQGMKNN